MGILAGVSRIDVTPAPGVPLMGYGARKGVSTGVAAPIFARALFLSGTSESGNSPGILVVCIDICLIGTDQAGGLREQIAAATGVPAPNVLIACSHTHSGPETGLAAISAGEPPPAWVAPLFAGGLEAARRAWAARAPARLGWARAQAAIGRNRRLADGPLDPEIGVLRVDLLDGRPLAVWFRHACHGTVLGHDSLDISPDWPGAASRRIEAATGAVAGFLLGAHADVDPRTRGLMDLAIPGQSIGLGHAAVDVLGFEVADAVLGVLGSAVMVDDAPIAAGTGTVSLPTHLGDLDPALARTQLAERKQEIATLLGVTPETLPRLAQLWSAADRLSTTLPIDEARERVAKVRAYVRDKTAPHFVGNRRDLDVEVQVLRIGDATLLALPLEPTTAVGLDWKSRPVARAFGGVVGIGNGWLRYLPHADDLAHPRSHQHYEVLQSLFAPGACEKLLDAGERLASTL